MISLQTTEKYYLGWKMQNLTMVVRYDRDRFTKCLLQKNFSFDQRVFLLLMKKVATWNLFCNLFLLSC